MPGAAGRFPCRANFQKKGKSEVVKTVVSSALAALQQLYADIRALQVIIGYADIEAMLDRHTHFPYKNIADIDWIPLPLTHLCPTERKG